MLKQEWIIKTEKFLRSRFDAASYLNLHPDAKAYRLEHTYRVANIGKQIALQEGFDETELVIACLLHDVIEDCGRTLEDLPVDAGTKELVRLLTCEDTDDSNRERILKDYYKNIVANPKAALIKCMDRCNNLTTMSWGLSRERIYRMIKETEEYYPALINSMKKTIEYDNAAWLLRYQIESMRDIYKRLM